MLLILCNLKKYILVQIKTRFLFIYMTDVAMPQLENWLGVILNYLSKPSSLLKLLQHMILYSALNYHPIQLIIVSLIR